MHTEPTRRFPKEPGLGAELLRKWLPSSDQAKVLVALGPNGAPNSVLLLLNNNELSASAKAMVVDATKKGRYKLVP